MIITRGTEKPKPKDERKVKNMTNTTTKTALISIFLNTWGNYNENGADGGFWVDLPCNLEETLERLARSTGEQVEEMEVFINDFSVEINGVYIDEYTDIENLNEIAEQLEEMDADELEKIESIIETEGGSIEKAVEEIDNYTYYSGYTLEDLAYEIVEECYDLPEIAQRYFDYAAFARDLGFDGYTETEHGVICR